MKKNIIDEKVDKVSDTITNSRSVFQFLNLIWYFLLIVAILCIVIGIGVLGFDKDGEDSTFGGIVAAIAGVLIFIPISLIRATTRKINKLKED